MNDQNLLDLVSVPQLSDRQLMERIARQLDRIEGKVDQMSVENDYMQAALQGLDVQLGNLGIRLQSQADELKRLVETAADYEQLRQQVNAAADRIQADAVAVSGMAQPSVVVDPDTPDEPTQIPTDPADPIPSPPESSGDSGLS